MGNTDWCVLYVIYIVEKGWQIEDEMPRQVYTWTSLTMTAGTHLAHSSTVASLSLSCRTKPLSHLYNIAIHNRYCYLLYGAQSTQWVTGVDVVHSARPMTPTKLTFNEFSFSSQILVPSLCNCLSPSFEILMILTASPIEMSWQCSSRIACKYDQRATDKR
jgi:hypothetical protein